jgi:hypothetical protein
MLARRAPGMMSLDRFLRRRSGKPVHMEGGVALFLLFVLIVVAIGFGIALYITGGAIIGIGERRERRPRGKTHPIAENTSAMRTTSEREPSER